VDIAAMASALEVRAPFLDRDLVRLALAIPSRLKVGRRRGKEILRAAVRRDAYRSARSPDARPASACPSTGGCADL
jgi:asparagine synthetase B (glutamine-hydrolysing)